MKAKHQRLILVALATAAMVAAVLLGMSALKDRAAYFYAPGDAARDHVAAGKAIRLGGVVTAGSVKRGSDGVTLRFVVHDEIASVPVRFRGVPPDLFREGSGVVAEGAFDPAGTFVAGNLLAKHDENYKPPVQAGAMHQTASLRR